MKHAFGLSERYMNVEVAVTPRADTELQDKLHVLYIQ